MGADLLSGSVWTGVAMMLDPPARRQYAATAREPVSLHLRNAVTPLMKSTGYGQGSRYVHDDPAARGEMNCLSEFLKGRVYYEPEIDDPGAS